ncbi:MAG: NlpC/P60 family protein [Crocinitomicaceae bacterium]|nr:NlpC/P60 family protein [Flavobacteriia bacterium]NDC28799.1 NlpC/P60 family protein [Crocinitomicaceae bacterium]NDC93180.1 NlpC/P60 family protein [Flavobacteriales bacterium]
MSIVGTCFINLIPKIVIILQLMTNSFFFRFIVSFFCISMSTFMVAQTIDVKKDHLNSSDSIVKKNNPKADAIISYAKTFLGVPYRYGGSTPSGFDCSGFINYIFGNFGFSLVRSSFGLADLGETIALSNIQPGDLLFFKGSNINSSTVGHVALVVEVAPNTLKFIHSANGGVRIENFVTSKYYIQRYIKAKRLDYGGN